MALFSRPDTALEVARRDTRRNQASAADPSVSAWVSANAGTGKTHVLTMRLLRLLLAQEPPQPERILALTYTKAAAAEMATRVFDRLAEWVTASDPALQEMLAELLDRPPSPEETIRARRLFARAIETPGGLKVQTIHAFCERLLQRFPIEAGVPAGFEILDDQTRGALLAEAVDEMLSEATAAKGDPVLARALAAAVAFAAEHNFDDLLAEAMRQHEWLDAAARFDVDPSKSLREAERIYRRALSIEPRATPESVTAAAAAVLSDAELRRTRDVLASGSANDKKAADAVAAAIAAGGQAARTEALSRFFMTTGGEVRKSLLSAKLAADHADVAGFLSRAQTAFIALHGERCKLQLLEATMALVCLGGAAMQRYGAAKARRAALDFDDLIGKAASLLQSSGAVEWVLYKLDGGLDHILVDEAQDTSPIQWQIVRALAEEFFAGKGREAPLRTLFAVGDEKQSIYSFQGAAPEMFAKEGGGFADRAAAGGSPWRRIPLTLSFRSVAPLLAAVDRIFENPQVTPGVAVGEKTVRHVANRAGHAGLVEIWPTEKHQAPAGSEPWSPLEEEGTTPSVVRLASRIADTIDRWFQNREMLASENRPIRPGDILILVRKRQPFASAMISALKARGIDVAGADRLILTEQIAVQDLMALGDFVLLPSDDLVLASLLKSPLIGFDDEHLTALSLDGTGSLWDRLRFRAASDACLRSAVERLQIWQVRSEYLPPFEFYASVLDADGGRAQLLARLGAEAVDAIDEFLNLALGYDDAAPPSLQGFLAWLREGRREIKRDMEQGRDQVRVMTVHGAKGLEAPIVFLPDTCTTRSARPPNGLLTLTDAERPSAVPPPFLWPVKGTNKVPRVQGAKALITQAETEERNRLLYVALTRARDRLYVSGFETSRPPPADCWYNLIRNALDPELVEAKADDGQSVWRLKSEQNAKPEKPKARARASLAFAPLPSWAKAKAPREPMLTMPLVPSRLAPLETASDASRAAGSNRRRPPQEPPILAPAALTDGARFLRGTLTHALLEHLPAIRVEDRGAAADAFLAGRAPQLPIESRRQIARETLTVVEDPRFAVLFGPESRAEVAIAAEVADPRGSGPALRLTGKIDRLVRTPDALMIVDYKTNRPPPADAAQIPEAYLFQLAAYSLGIADIFPGVPVRAAILWTDGPRMMEVPGDLLRSYEQQLWQLGPASLDA
jgi:ATP-dependent helicase/nuclease subunit A